MLNRLVGWQLAYGGFLKTLGIPCDGIRADGAGELAAAVYSGLVEIDAILDRLAKKTIGESVALPTPAELQADIELKLSPAKSTAERARTSGSPITQLGWPGQSGGEYRSLLTLLARLYVLGVHIDWRPIYPPDLEKVSVPYSPFERKPYWISRQLLETPSNIQTAAWLHPLLHRHYDLSGAEQVFETDLSKVEFLKDHRIQDAAVFPLAGYLEMAASAARMINGTLGTVDDLEITSPIQITGGEACIVQLVLRPEGAGWSATFNRKTPQGWQPHAACQILPSENHSDTSGAVAWPEVLNQPSAAAAIPEYYDRLRQAGLDYGPAFQTLQLLHADAGAAWAVIAAEQAGVSREFGIHPARLDGCFQAIASALPPEITTTLVPTHIKRFCIDRKLEGGEPLYCHVHHLQNEGAGFVVDLDIFDKHQTRVAQIEQLKLQPLERSRLGYYVADWPAQIRSKDFPPTYIEPPATLSAHLRSRYAQDYNVSQVEAHSALLDQLEEATAGCALDVLSQLGLDLRPGREFPLADAVQCCRVVETQEALFTRLLNMLVEDGHLNLNKGLYSVEKPIARSWMSAVPESSHVEFALFERCLEHLPDVMQGRCDPLEILFPTDEAASALQLYTESVGAKALNYLTAEVVAQIQSQLPEGRGLKILEVGAGTGATTEAVLKRTRSRRLAYAFTDISSHFFAAAKQQFSQYPISTYKTLDIESAPADQGFERESFNIIIAANVLHATSDLQRSLRHVRELLKPEGALLLVEGTRRVRWLDFVFGMTPGWWAFRDYDLRPDYPLISPEQWNEVLHQAGFGLVETFNPHGRNCKLEPANSLIVAKADAVLQPQDDSHTWLIIGNDSKAQRLYESLIARNQNSRLIPWPADHRNPEGNELLITADDLTKPRLNILAFWPHTSDDTENAPDVALQGCEAVLNLAQTIVRQTSEHAFRPRLVFLTEGVQAVDDRIQAASPADASLLGFVRSLSLEKPDWTIQAIDLDRESADTSLAACIDELLLGSSESEVAFRDGERRVRRLAELDPAHLPATSIKVLTISRRGAMDGLELSTLPARTLKPDELLIDVAASGLNFRDVLNVLGIYPGRPPLGAECAGTVRERGSAVTDFQIGDRVVVVAPNTCCNQLFVPAELAAPIPSFLSLTEAATIPIAFLTAWYALEHEAALRSGQRVLIHSATGGVGHAAVQMASAIGAEIYATASAAKLDYLRTSLAPDHIYNSRSPGFAEAILNDTKQQGVDVLLNTLGDEFVDENLRALAANGLYVDLSKPQAGIRAYCRAASRCEIHGDRSGGVSRSASSTGPRAFAGVALSLRGRRAFAASESRVSPRFGRGCLSASAIGEPYRQSLTDTELAWSRRPLEIFSPTDTEPTSDSFRFRLCDQWRNGRIGFAGSGILSAAGSNSRGLTGPARTGTCPTAMHSADRSLELYGVDNAL